MKYAILHVLAAILAAILAAAALSSPAPKPPIAAASDPYAAVPESELTYGDAEAYSH